MRDVSSMCEFVQLCCCIFIVCSVYVFVFVCVYARTGSREESKTTVTAILVDVHTGARDLHYVECLPVVPSHWLLNICARGDAVCIVVQ